MNIHESAEDYLEAILILKERQGLVRSIDIVRENGYIEMDAEGYLSLLPSGMEIAQRIYTRHRLLSQFLQHLGVSEETAAADACKIEHDISVESFEKIVAYAKQAGLIDEAD